MKMTTKMFILALALGYGIEVLLAVPGALIIALGFTVAGCFGTYCDIKDGQL